MIETATVSCFWEHNGNDTLLYAIDFPGAYTRGETLSVAVSKMATEILSYSQWCDINFRNDFEIIIREEKATSLNVQDADSDAIFDEEKRSLTIGEYRQLKALALKSANDFLLMYNSIPNKNSFLSSPRKTFYGQVPRSANEMYEHTKNVNEYYFNEIGVSADNVGDIYECRHRGFLVLESTADFLTNTTVRGSYLELWSLRKLLRRFIWHDRIHAKAMYRMAIKQFSPEQIKNPFCFKI